MGEMVLTQNGTIAMTAGWRIPQKVKGAILTMETAFYIIIIAIFAAIAVSTLVDTDSAKKTTTTQEIEQIRTAAVQYKAFYVHEVNFSDGFPELFGYIEASDAVDARRHGPFLAPNSTNDNDGRWSTAGAIDMWGNPYKFDTSTYEIYSTCGGADEEDQIRAYIGGE